MHLIAEKTLRGHSFPCYKLIKIHSLEIKWCGIKSHNLLQKKNWFFALLINEVSWSVEFIISWMKIKKNVIISDLLTLSFHISLIIIIIQICSQWSRQLLLFGDKLYLQANDWFLRLRYIPTAATNCTYLIYRSVHWLQRYASQVNSSQNDVITIQGFTKSKFSLKIECCYFTDMIFAK